MKLAQLLNARADLSGRITREVDLLKRSTKTNEGEDLLVNPDEAFATISDLISEHGRISARINQVNNATPVTVDDQEMSLADVIIRRASVARIVSTIDMVLNTATEAPNRWGRNELVTRVNIDIDTWRETRNTWQRQLRTIDEALQEANWSTEVGD